MASIEESNTATEQAQGAPASPVPAPASPTAASRESPSEAGPPSPSPPIGQTAGQIAAAVAQQQLGAGTAHIEIDHNEDQDSQFGDDSSSLTSLESWVLKYRMENGRRFHSYKDGAYLLPNDEAELDRLDLHHHIFTLILKNKLHLAPISNPDSVLDVGTGTGIWAIDFAEQYPDSYVIGVDLSAVQPSWVPTNVEFQIDDVEDPWTHHKKFDYIHIRSMAGSISNWPRLLRQAYDQLKPGGWVEVQEFEIWIRSDDGTLELVPMVKQWQSKLSEASQIINKPFVIAPKVRDWVMEAGFDDVQETVIKVPQGPWPLDKNLKMIGLFHREMMMEAASSYGLAHFTRVLGWSAEEFQVLAGKVRTELKRKDVHLFSYFHDIYGRKPE